ncbi:MAG: Dabb family protein [bacterium]
MVRHIVCIKLIDATAATMSETKRILMSMVGKVPTALEVNVLVDALRSERSYDVMLDVVVENWAKLDEYQADPYHCNIVKKYLQGVMQNAITIDSEI